MKSLPMKPEIWKLKLPILQVGGEAQTRRLLKPQPALQIVGGTVISGHWQPKPSEHLIWANSPLQTVLTDVAKYARYHEGEIAYVPEAWAVCPSDFEDTHGVIYKADGKYNDYVADFEWGSPRVMPQWAARWFVLVTAVTPELFRLARLTPQDIEAEGGEPALKLLREYDGKWLFAYRFRLKPRPEGVC